MPAARIPIDGLWRCLCPSFDALLLSKPIRTIRPRAAQCLARPQLRALHTTPSSQLPEAGSAPRELRDDRERVNRKPVRHLDGRGHRFSNAQGLREHRGSSKQEKERARVNDEAADRILRAALKSKAREKQASSPLHPGLQPEEYRKLDLMEINELHDKLGVFLRQKGGYWRVVDLVQYLITARGDPVGLVHYDALVRANADAEFGNAEVVAGLLRQMKEGGVKADSGFYHGVLRALTIHPDYVLRNEIMDDMKERWYGLSPEGWHDLVVCLLRDNHLEIAMDKIEQMHQDQIFIQPWLYDILTFKLCECDELDEALRITAYRWEILGEDIRPTIWYYLLDKFTGGLHYDGTQYVWRARINGAHVVPSDGVCLAILNLAARYADPNMATDALRLLTERKTALSSYHYEALLEAYLASGDMRTAFRILVIMAKAGIEPKTHTTRPIFAELTKHASKTDHAWLILKDMNDAGHTVPIAAANVVLEAVMVHKKLRTSLDMYKELHTMCKPNTETFNTLLKRRNIDFRSRQEDRQEASNTAKRESMFLAAEMLALGIKPDRLTYDRLVLVCAQNDDYEDAFSYWKEMKDVGRTSTGTEWELRNGTFRALIQRCAQAGDERTWGLITQLGERGMDTAEIMAYAERVWGAGRPRAPVEEWAQLKAGSSAGKTAAPVEEWAQSKFDSAAIVA